MNDGFRTKKEVVLVVEVCKCGKPLKEHNLRIKWGSYLGQGGVVLQKCFVHTSCKKIVWVDEQLPTPA